jgi:hypothetical protein
MAVPLINPGEPIRASWLNELVGAVNAAAGGGGRDSSIEAALALALSAFYGDLFVPVRIMRVLVAGQAVQTWTQGATVAPITTTSLPSAVSYDVRGIRRGFVIENRQPIYGRPVRNDEARIYPASAGLVALVERSPRGGNQAGRAHGNLMLLPGSEIVARRPCQPGTLLRGPTGPELTEEELEELPLPRPQRVGSITRVGGDGTGASQAAGGGPAGSTPGDGGVSAGDGLGGNGSSLGG